MKDIPDIISVFFKSLKENTKALISTLVSALILLGAFYFFFLSSPFNFPIGQVIKIEKGTGLNQVTEMLHQKEVIKSKFWFKYMFLIFGGQKGVVSGDYFFNERWNLFGVMSRVIKGEYGLTPISVTVPEGATVYEMSLIVSEYLPEFDPEEFLRLAQPIEGYMFPDTYFFLPNTEAKEVADTMKTNFLKRVSEIYDEIEEFGKPIEEIIIMASLIEEEAKDPEARRMISGILWNRIDIDMLLQVDAVFPYIINKNTFQVTLEDLKVDSPYNTYKHKGLPAGPISNPGLDSILAAVNPTENDYFYYLSDYNGNMHYAETFQQHKINKYKYLR